MLKRLTASIPEQYRSNFIHLYFDIGWYAVLAGSAVNFINVYATRLGATGQQIGLLTAMGAFINLIIAIPAGRWLEKRPIHTAIFWSSVVYRFGFLLWVFLPWLFKPTAEVNALIIINALMAIPLTALGVGFNALFAAAVPADWRAQVAGARNVVLSIVFMLSSYGSGVLLEHLPFPLGYQIIFAIGFFGAAMSSLHLYFIKPLSSESQPDQTPPQPASTPRPVSPRRDWRANLRLDIWKTPFSKVLLVFLAFHLTQFLPIPIFPLFNVHVLHLNDEQIGIGTAFFYLTVLMGSTRLHRIVHRLGHKGVTSIGVLGLSLYPLLLSISTRVWHFYGVSLVGGLCWALAGGASGNYLIENIPENDRPAHLAWYAIILNGCILVGSLVGPSIADQLGLPAALFVFGILRALAGVAILMFG